MLRSLTACLFVVGLATSLGACSSTDSGSKTEPVVEQDAAEETVEGEDAAPEAEIEAAAEAAVEAAAEAAAEAGVDAAPDVPVEAAEAAVKKCPYEVSLANSIPCMCGKIFVEDLEVASPGCTLKVVCCPSGGGTIKCE